MKAEYNEYDNFRWINLNRWSIAKEVNALVGYLVRGVGSRKLHGYLINMTALVLDLYHSYLCDPEQYLAYNRVEAAYKGVGGGHPFIKNPNIAYHCLLKCIDYLFSAKLVENHEGGRFYDEEAKTYHSFVSRMRPLPDFMALVNEYGLKPEMISVFAPEDVVLLRGKENEKTGERPTLKTPRNKTTNRMITIIGQYNALLERSHIDVDIECLTNKDRDELVVKLADMDMAGTKRIVLRLSQKSVYRVFNNGSLEQGGRYYGAWWISAPGIVRKYITIQGDPTVELDFKAMHIHLLYAVKGVNYADKHEDAYTLAPGAYTLLDPKDDRALNKLILLTAFNAATTELAASAVFDQARKDGNLKLYKLTDQKPIKTRLALLKQKHPVISDLIASGYGLKLQYFDSCIIEKVIAYLTSLAIPVLTVHDSVICQVQYEELVRNVMVRYFYQVVEELLELNVKPTPLYSRAGFILNHLNSKLPFKARSSMLKVALNLNAVTHVSYTGRITDTIANNLGIEADTRANACSKGCNHMTRLVHRLKFIPNIKLELQELTEAKVNVLRIK